jgi:DNA replication protein DnaC
VAGFDFEVSPEGRKLVTTLATTAFTDDAHRAVLVGGPGTGKTHLATAIGISGITGHVSVWPSHLDEGPPLAIAAA